MSTLFRSFPHRFIREFAGTLYLLAFLLIPVDSRAQVSVWTNHNDNARTGANLSETILNTSNVNVNQFGKLFAYTVDGSVYSQPLYIPNVPIVGIGMRNVLYIATMNDSVYAFDADATSAAGAQPLWMVNFTNLAAGITAVPSDDVQIAATGKNIAGPIGIEGTPVIDRSTNTIYFVARTKENGVYFQRLHALDITSGAEKFGGPVAIQASVPSTTGYDVSNGMVTFGTLMQNQRPGLALVNGMVLIGWASHGGDVSPFHGWLMAYDTQTLKQLGVFNSTPNGGEGGIWMSGQPPAVDAAGNVYFSTGNGDWDSTHGNFAQSVIQLSTANKTIALSNYFTPYNWASINVGDQDLGVTGNLLIPNTKLLLVGSKAGDFYLLNTANLGGIQPNNSQIPQDFVAAAGHTHGAPVYWNSPNLGPLVYIWPEGDFLKALHFNGATFDTTPAMESTFRDAVGMPGAMLSLSANGSTAGTGILWTSMPYSQDALIAVVPGVFRAFDATDVTKELWDTHLNLTRDDLGNFAKFCPPTVVKGRVYLATFSNQVVVYGLLATAGGGGGGGGGITAGSPGLTGSLSTPTATQNLTTLGTSDWAHWGLTSSTSFDHKSAGGSQIANFTVINGQAGSVANFGGNAIGYTWSDGTPDTSVANTATGVYISGQNKGFQVQVPADTSSRTLTVYLGVYNTTGKLVAHLSDSSAPDYVDSTLTSGGSQVGAYTLNYAAGSSGQTLTVTFTQTTASGNVNLQSAALQLGGAPTPDFSLSATPTSQTVTPGASTTFTANVGALNGFTGNVSLNVTGLPANASWSFAPSSITTSGGSTLTLTTASNTPSGSSKVTISATSGALTHSTAVTLVVSSGTSSSNAISVDFDGSSTTAMAVSETAGVIPKTHWNNAQGAVSSSALALIDETGAPSGASVTWKADNTWNTPIADQAGNFRMMRGYLDTGNTNPTTVSVTGLSGGTYDIYVYADGDNGSGTRTGAYQLSGPGITTTTTSLTDAANLNFNGTFIAANNSSGNYIKFGSVPASSFTLTVTPTATSNGYLRAPINGLQIIPTAPPQPDFTLSANPTTQTVAPGGSTSFIFTITSLNGFSGTVNFGVTGLTGLPAGSTSGFSPTTVTGSGTTTLSITTASNSTGGNYPLVITATSGVLSHTSTVTLGVNVPDFTIAATPSSQTVSAGGGTTFTATIGAINGFTGSVTFQASGLPSGASASFNPTTVTGAGSSTLTISTATNTPGGNSMIMISGTSASLSHPATVSLTVTTLTTSSGVMSVDFVGGSGTNPMGTSETAGVVAKTHWNNAGGASSASPLNLIDELGNSTSATVSWVSDGLWSTPINDQPGNYRMIKGYLDSVTNPTVVTVGNLTFQSYDIYVYIDGDNGATTRTGTYQLSGSGITTSTVSVTDAANTNFAGTFKQANNSAGNFIRFGGISTSGFTLTATPTQSTDSYLRAPINGIQIVPVAAAQPDFTISATPASQNVMPGNNGSYTFTLAPLGGFTGTVSLSVSGQPSGSIATFTPSTLSNGSGTTTLGVPVPANTALGSYPLLVTASSGPVTHTANVTLIVGSNGGPMLQGSYFIPTTVQNLTTLGTSDWAHWGLVSNTSFDHKAGVTSQISNYTVVNGEVGNLAASPSNAMFSTWTDGTPDLTATATQSGLYVRLLNAGYQITAPAGKNPQLLTLYVGVGDAQGKLTAHLSDGSAPDFIDTSVQNASQLCVAYTLVYSAASDGQTLTVSWTENTAPYFASQVSLMSATLSMVSAGADFSISGTPSTQSITPGAVSSYAVTVAPLAGFGAPVTLGVTGLPAGISASFSPSTLTASGMSNLTLNASTSTPPGQYSFAVTATAPGVSHSLPLVLNVVNGAGPYIAGSFAVPGAIVNLTAQGSADWAHWGLNNSTTFDHKAHVTPQISNYTVVQGQAGQVGQAAAALPFSWSDGTPDTSSSGTNTSVFIKGLNYGFQITVPADTTARTLTLYAGVFNTQGKFTAHISDGSAADFVDTSLNSSGVFTGAYTVAYKAASANQTLTVTYTQNTMSGPRCAEISGVHCFAILQSATLAVNPPDFALTTPSPSQTAGSGSSVNYTVSLAALNGFTGIVNFTVTGLPSGATTSFLPSSLSGGSGSSTLTINVPQNAPAVSYQFNIIATSGSLTHTLPAILTVATATAGAQHYVSTTGSSAGDGTINNPWDLQTALNQPASVQPGDAIWLRGGVYGNGTTAFTSSVTGTASQPIVVRQYPGEHATVSGDITVNGSYARFWGFEVTNLTGTDRSAAASGNTGPPNFLPGLVVFGPGTQFINMVVHDTGQGFSFWMPATDSEIYGSLVYNNGWQGTARGQGHGIYTENQTGLKTIADNIIFQGFGEGIQCYGSSQAFVQNYLFDGNIIFNSGALSTAGDDYNLLVAGGPGPQNITVTNTYTYHTPSVGTGLSSLSWIFDPQASSLTASGNYWIGGNPAIDVNNWNGATFTNNVIYSQTGYLLTATNLFPTTYNWNNNAYYQAANFAEFNNLTQSFAAWQSATGLDQSSTLVSAAPSGTWTFVRPNQFESGRANITIYNWNLASSVAVDVSKVLSVGSHYVVQPAQNFYGPPAVSGTYAGGTILVPMSGWTAAQAIGTGIPNQPQATGPQFGAFVLLQQ